MSKYIDAEKMKTEIERKKEEYKKDRYMSDYRGKLAYYKDKIYDDLLSFITSLQQGQPKVDLEKEIDEKWNEFVSSEGEREDFTRIVRHFYELGLNSRKEQPEVDLEKLKNKAELIANGIMIGVQANKYHTCIYDKASNDFNHSHLFRAALKGIEVGLNEKKEK